MIIKIDTKTKRHEHSTAAQIYLILKSNVQNVRNDVYSYTADTYIKLFRSVLISETMDHCDTICENFSD